jgi:hypothetical protein
MGVLPFQGKLISGFMFSQGGARCSLCLWAVEWLRRWRADNENGSDGSVIFSGQVEWGELGNTCMNASMPRPQRNQSVWFSTAVWLSAFLSPTVYFLLLLLASSFRIQVPQAFVWSLFFVVPLFAVLICMWVVWASNKTVAHKIGWMFFTLVAISVQFAVLLVILRTILVTMIGYAQ